MKIIDGGVTAPKGFKANGIYCGIKKANPANESPNSKHKNDLGAIVSDIPCNTACVYTQNKVQGAPITVTKSNLKKSGGKSVGVIVNSKYANTCNADGIEKAKKMCALFADAVKARPEEIIVASTGVIGQVLPMEPIEKGIPALVEGLCYNKSREAATAIMTTDTFPKEYAVSFEIDGTLCTIGGMAKGSGMIHPNMATTLNFITTDAAISCEMLQKALNDIVKITYNCLSVDGDTSTNDMVALMANGLACNDEITAEGENYEKFKEALYQVMMHLTRMLAKDGEGASKLLKCVCCHAETLDKAITIAKAVISSTLFKCAMFGADANCGRVLCAIGNAPCSVDISLIDVELQSESGSVTVCRGGNGIAFSEEEAAKILSSDEITIIIDLHEGSEKATAWGCDMTYDYIKINGSYRT